MISLCSVMTALTFFLMPAPTTLYNADLDPIVELPASYFVLQNSLDAPDGYISVMYDDLNGYIKADDLQEVDYTPVTKYETTVTFKCDNDGQAVNLRAAPMKNAQIITVLKSTESGHCYGSVRGEQLISGAGETWYYVNVNGLRGYCYCAHVQVDKTPVNIIEKEIPEQSTPAATQPENAENGENMPWIAAVIFIVALCIPVPFIMFYLFRKPKDDSVEP